MNSDSSETRFLLPKSKTYSKLIGKVNRFCLARPPSNAINAARKSGHSVQGRRQEKAHSRALRQLDVNHVQTLKNLGSESSF